ncbi:MAG: hypothetical protein JRH20_32000 [Deltaproteobacteria bacterium]|nr:hypothetical protein [Deltaproteobacteria bacterium]
MKTTFSPAKLVRGNLWGIRQTLLGVLAILIPTICAVSCDSTQPDNSTHGDTGCIHPDLPKYICPWPQGEEPCAQGLVCRAYSECAEVSCGIGPECEEPTVRYSFSASIISTETKPMEGTYAWTPTLKENNGVPFIELGDASSKLLVSWNLPANMPISVEADVPLRVTVCDEGNPINPSWVLVVRTLEGSLVVAGGVGSNILDSECFTGLVDFERVDLGCAIREDLSVGGMGFFQNFGAQMRGDAAPIPLLVSTSVALSTHEGPLRVLLTNARYPIESNASDIAGSIEGVVIVPDVQ